MADKEESDTEGAAAEGDAAKAPKKALPILNIALGLQVVVLLAAAGVMMKFVFFNHRPKLTREVLGERAITSLRDESAEIRVLDMNELTVNLPDKRNMMAHIQLEVSNPEVEAALKRRMPALNARLLDIMGAQNSSIAENIQGKLLLKEKIRAALNTELEKASWDTTKGVVREVFFVNLILQ